MQESGLDFIVFMLVLGMVVALGFGYVNPLVKESRELVYYESYDKTVQKIQGDKAKTTADGSLGIEGIVLQVMGQSYFMPSPRKLDICGIEHRIDYEEGYTPIAKSFGVRVYEDIKNWGVRFIADTGVHNDLDGLYNRLDKLRFKIMFDYGLSEGTEDDKYSLYIKLKKRGETDRYYKCLSNGKVDLSLGKM